MSNLFAIVFVRQLFYKDEFARKISLKNMFLNIFFDFFYLTSNRKRVIKQLYYSLLYSHLLFLRPPCANTKIQIILYSRNKF